MKQWTYWNVGTGQLREVLTCRGDQLNRFYCTCQIAEVINLIGLHALLLCPNLYYQGCQPKIATWRIWNYKKVYFLFFWHTTFLTILWICVMPTTMVFFVSFSILLIYDNILMLRFCHSLPMHVQVKEIPLFSVRSWQGLSPKFTRKMCTA